MNEAGTRFSNLIKGKVRNLLSRHRAVNKLRVAVLGPGLQNPDDLGSQKRRQIFHALKDDGHDPFYPEEIVDDSPTTFILDEERQALIDPNGHLVLILHTSTHGVSQELSSFSHVDELVAKTVVLFPLEHYEPEDGGVPPNTAREYPLRWTYTEEQFVSCRLVSECRKWAEQRSTGRWPGLPSRHF